MLGFLFPEVSGVPSNGILYIHLGVFEILEYLGERNINIVLIEEALSYTLSSAQASSMTMRVFCRE